MTKQWEDVREQICTLYEDHTLEVVRQIMRDHYEFKASTRSYRDKLKRWNACKFSRRSTSPLAASPNFSESGSDSGRDITSMKAEEEHENMSDLSASPPMDPAPLPHNYSQCQCPGCPGRLSAMERKLSNDSNMSFDEQDRVKAARTLMTLPQTQCRIEDILNHDEPSSNRGY